MNTKKTIALALILLGLGVFVFWYELPRQQQETREKQQVVKVLDLPWEQIDKIELARGEERLAFVKDAASGQWTIKEPIVDQADKLMVQRLISAAQFAHPSYTVEAPTPAQLDQFGFAERQMTISYFAGSQVGRLQIGGKNPVGFSVYIKPEGRDVAYLVAESTTAEFDVEVDDFRRRELLLPPPNDQEARPGAEIRRIAIEAAGRPPLTLLAEATEPAAERLSDELVWRVDSPDGAIADQAAVGEILNKIHQLKGIDFLPPPKPEEEEAYGFATPRLRITVGYDREDAFREITLTVGRKREPGASYYGRISGREALVLINQSVLPPFEIERRELRDRRLLPDLDPAAVSIIDLQSPTALFTISRSSAGWLLGDGSPADGERVEKWLRLLPTLRAEELLSQQDDWRSYRRLHRLAAYGPDATTLTLKDRDGKLIEKIRFSKPADPLERTNRREQQAAAATDADGGPEGPGEDSDSRLRVIALPEKGGFSATLYLAKADIVDDFPASLNEIKARNDGSPDERGGAEATEKEEKEPVLPIDG